MSQTGLNSLIGSIAVELSSGQIVSSLDRVSERVRVAALADDCEVFLGEPTSGDLLLAACRGVDAELLAAKPCFARGSGYPGICTDSNAPIVRDDLRGDGRYLRRPVLDAGVRASVAVPLRAYAGVPIGSLHVYSRREDYAVDDALALLEALAGPFALAVTGSLAMLSHAVDDVCATLDAAAPREVLEAALGRIVRLSGARRATLVLGDSASGCTREVLSTGPLHLLCDSVRSGDLSRCPALDSTGGGIVLAGRRRGWPCRCRSLPPRLKAGSCIPLVAAGRLYGMIVLDFGRRKRPPIIGELVPLSTLGRRMAANLPAHLGVPLVERELPASKPRIVSAGSSRRGLLELRCLGPFEIVLDGERIPDEAFPRNKARTLLQLLVMHGGAPIKRDVLAESLWPGVGARSGVNRLHGVVHALRSVIEPHREEQRWLHVHSQGDAYVFDGKAHRIDIDAFCRGLATARSAATAGRAPQDAIEPLESAVQLYRGDLFSDDPYAYWCEARRAELREQYLDALKRLAALYERCGDHERAIERIRRGLRCDYLREDLHQQLIALLMQAGRRSDALAQYDECARVMREELDAAPLPETERLHDELRRALG